MRLILLALSFTLLLIPPAPGLEIEHVGTFPVEAMGIKDSSGTSMLWAMDVLASGTTGYLLMYNRFSTLDLSDISHPKGMSLLSLPGYYEKLSQLSDSIITGYGRLGLVFIDVSNREAPSILSSMETRGDVSDIEFVGNTAYIADSSDGLLVADITSVTSPVIISTNRQFGSANGLEVVGRFLYTDFFGTINQLVVFNVSTRIPVFQDSIEGSVGTILRSNSNNQLVSNLIKIFDIANPALPQLTVSFYPGMRVSGLMVDDNYIYASGSLAIPDTDGQDVFSIYNLNGEAHDVVAEWIRYDTYNFLLTGMSMDGNIVYIADLDMGLTILRIENESGIPEDHWCQYE